MLEMMVFLFLYKLTAAYPRCRIYVACGAVAIVALIVWWLFNCSVLAFPKAHFN